MGWTVVVRLDCGFSVWR